MNSTIVSCCQKKNLMEIIFRNKSIGLCTIQPLFCQSYICQNFILNELFNISFIFPDPVFILR
jgi:hypothetical protein